MSTYFRKCNVSQNQSKLLQEIHSRPDIHVRIIEYTLGVSGGVLVLQSVLSIHQWRYVEVKVSAFLPHVFLSSCLQWHQDAFHHTRHFLLPWQRLNSGVFQDHDNWRNQAILAILSDVDYQLIPPCLSYLHNPKQTTDCVSISLYTRLLQRVYNDSHVAQTWHVGTTACQAVSHVFVRRPVVFLVMLICGLVSRDFHNYINISNNIIFSPQW